MRKKTTLYDFRYILAVLIIIPFNLLAKNTTNLVKMESSFVYQQEIRVRGKVLDDQGVPLVGATVMEQGTTNGTTTDFDGNYEIVVASEESVLEFTYVGFQRVTEVVGEKRNFDISLEAETNELEELVIVGYSKVSREELTAAVSSVNQEQIDL